MDNSLKDSAIRNRIGAVNSSHVTRRVSAVPESSAVTPSSAVERLKPYETVKQEAIFLEDPRTASKLDWNESTESPSEEIVESLIAELRKGTGQWYPDVNSYELIKELARYTGLDSAYIQTFPGSDSALEYVCRTFLNPGEEVLVAVGREPNSDILRPEKSGIETDERGWIMVNRYLETNVRGVYAVGDANGKHMFRHVANREAVIAYMNAFHDAKIEMDYSAIPHAVFCQPEVASVGLREKEAVEKYGRENILIGFEEIKSTGKGQGLNAKGFAKIIINRETERIVGAHVVGKAASVLIQEVTTVMALNAPFHSILHAIHIHPSLSEVISWACGNLMSVDDYHRKIEKEL